MSIRSHSNGGYRGLAAAPSSAIDFKDEFVNSTAALAASHDDTVNHILQRLDQLQTKISGQQETPAPAARSTASSTTPKPTDLHSRLSQLESIHEDSLRSLGSKLDVVERKLSDNKEAETLMGNIASKFSQLETRLQSATQLQSRFDQLESRLGTQSDLQSRISKLESRLGHSDIHARISKLESHLQPDPEQERILTRINSKLDQLERKRDVSLGASLDSSSRSRTPEQENHRSGLKAERQDFVGSEAEREQRIKYLQTRIEKLKELRMKYEED